MAAAIAAAALPGVATALGLNADGDSYLRLERVVFDERFADARAFAEEARRRSVRTSAINGSIHDLWYHDLFYHWRDAKYPIAGITDHRALFLLEMMATDAGMRRSSHTPSRVERCLCSSHIRSVGATRRGTDPIVQSPR